MFLFLATISCSTGRKGTSHFKINVDSVFVESFAVERLPEFKEIEKINIRDDQSFFEHELNQFSFHVFSVESFSDTIDIKIVLGKPKYPVVYDGELKIVYLITVGQSGKQIDAIRVGKTEGVAGFDITETSMIENNLIKRKSDEKRLNDEDGTVIHQLKSETFKISNNGRIVFQPTL